VGVIGVLAIRVTSPSPLSPAVVVVVTPWHSPSVSRRRHCCNAVALAIHVTSSLSLSCCASQCHPSWCHALCVVVMLWHWLSTSHHCHHCCSRQLSPSPLFLPAIVVVVFLRLAWTRCHRGIGCHHCHLCDTRALHHAIVTVVPVLPLSHLHHGCGDVIVLVCMAAHPGGRQLWLWLHHQ